jgi:serine/threonine-protein kinase
MAEVFLAMAQGTHGVRRLAVVKRLRHPDDPEMVRMFLDEARLAARLSHPNIVHTYEVGDAGGEHFLALEYLEGQSLSKVLKKVATTPHGLPDSLVVGLTVEILKGLHYAHELQDFDGTPLGIVHRDVSPHNVFVTYDGVVKLLDFGIAKTVLNLVRTQAGVLKGKAAYMSPEQAGRAGVDRRADVYAAGVVLWEMFARRPLFTGDPASILRQLVNEPRPSLRSAYPDVAPELDAIVSRALKRDRDERYATAEEMRLDLEAFLHRSGETPSDKEMARTMDVLFGATRDRVRGRIQRYIGRLDRDGGEARLSTEPAGGDLPFVDSVVLPPNAETPSLTTSTRTSAPAMAPPLDRSRGAFSRAGSWLLAANALFVGAAAASVIAMQNRASLETRAAANAPANTGQTAASLRVETVPAGARVERNGQFMGLTPTEFAVETGSQSLLVWEPGFAPETLAVELKSGERAMRTLVLRPESASAPTASTAAPIAADAPSAPSASSAPTVGATRGREQPPAAPRPTSFPAPVSVAPPAAARPTVPAGAAARPKIRIID